MKTKNFFFFKHKKTPPKNSQKINIDIEFSEQMCFGKNILQVSEQVCFGENILQVHAKSNDFKPK
jgi:citrate lyase gamma subunit